MQCPLCNYMMSDFDTECPRCQGKGIPKPAASAPQVAPQQAAPVAAPLPLPPEPRVKFADADAIERLCGIGFLAGMAISFYFFFFFDTSVEVPTTDFMGTTIGGGRVNNLGLMADRQNGIIFGMGLAILSVIIYFVVQSKSGQNQ